jgi:hypothetical protein
MTPMRANSDQKAQPAEASHRTRLNLVRDTSEANQRGEISVFKAAAAETAGFRAVTLLEGIVINGTIDAAVGRIDEQSYAAASDALLSGAAPIRTRQQAPAAAARTRATELVTELREISGQVNRMMSQVDRAIHRLGVHAGEPIRR